MTTDQAEQADDDSADAKRKVTRMTFAERYNIAEKMKDMVDNGHSLLPAKNWTALASVIKQLTGLPAYGALCKEIADVTGIAEDKLIEKRVSPEEKQQAETASLRQRIEELEGIVNAQATMLDSLSKTVVELARQPIVPEMPPPQVPSHAPRHTFLPPDVQCADE